MRADTPGLRKVAIIGGGIAGLSALHFVVTRHGQACRPTLFEKENRLGGTIGTDRDGGFVSEWGPNGFLDKVPLTLRMVRELGADHLLAPAESSSGKRFIYAHGRLNEISASPIKFMSSPLLSLAGRLRLAGEPFIKQKRDWETEESVFDFAARRIGPEAARLLIDPMVSGIFGGDARALSLKACFPIMVEMEREHGSLVKAMMARKKPGRRNESSPSSAGPAGHLTSFKLGMQTLIEIFEDRYSAYVRPSQPVTRISRNEQGFVVVGENGLAEQFDAVICSAPAFAASVLTAGLDRSLSELLASIPYAAMAVVCLGYRRQEVGHDLDGFGFLAPRSEGKRILGTIWSSSIFPDQAPAGTVQLRTMVGGATDPEAAGLSEKDLLKVVIGDLRPILKVSGDPAYVRIFKFERGIPQFVLGHPGKVEMLEARGRNFPGLYFTGNAYDGVGLNDCVVRSEKVVTQMVSDLQL